MKTLLILVAITIFLLVSFFQSVEGTSSQTFQRTDLNGTDESILDPNNGELYN